MEHKSSNIAHNKEEPRTPSMDHRSSNKAHNKVKGDDFLLSIFTTMEVHNNESGVGSFINTVTSKHCVFHEPRTLT
ncbi:hypothetical protein LR48_Vigan03g088700 [Vigna angularis]|uniref:Uncharacterized protein n=1 Tax=Phaseolus angularis TaxID=3914 RepID=A0A0L9U400_PHAAN|nr:hypothetical protein LR48_Vigan03g088700 [Vigna angularis]